MPHVAPSCSGALWAVEECPKVQKRRISLLASLQGGVAERSIKCREASTDREAGVVFRLRKEEKPTPGCVSFSFRLRAIALALRVWLRDIFSMTQPSPPCGDSRRGIRLIRIFFTALMSDGFFLGINQI